MKYVLPLLLLMATAPVQANDLRIERDACKLLTSHKPIPDVAYDAGVDVHGNAVAPADLSPPTQLGDTFTIPVTVDIGEQLGIPMGALDGTRATVALVTTDGDRAYLDGVPLTPEQEDNLAVLCLEDDTQ